jgi:type II secretory pathway component GspD/PulD (secretin)
MQPPAADLPSAQDIQIGSRQAAPTPPPPPANPLDTRIVVRVKNAPLATFLDTISAQAKVNFIITEGLETKRITAFLQNVTVREALQILLEIKGLTYQRIGRSNTYVVSARRADVPNRITRIYTLNHIPLVPISGDADSGGGGDEGGGEPQAEGSDAEGGGEEDGGGTGAVGGSADTSIPIISVLRSVLTRKYGDISVDSRTNSIIITDLPESFPQVEQILAELDVKAPQVMIEAQIVEINSDRANALGLEWGGRGGEMAVYTGPARDTAFPLVSKRENNKYVIFDPLNNIISRVSGGGEESGDEGGAVVSTELRSAMVTGSLDLTQLQIILRALVSRAEARFLGKPKILTMNNQEALITTERDEALSITTGFTASQGLSQSNTEIERDTTGLVLRVTPQVNQEGYITMLINPAFTNAIESRVSSQSQRVFDTAERTARALVRVKNGQTLVLGGLLESRESKSVRKVPFLGYIPLIGWLFTSTSSSRSNTDLVIFITPTIVND